MRTWGIVLVGLLWCWATSSPYPDKAFAFQILQVPKHITTGPSVHAGDPEASCPWLDSKALQSSSLLITWPGWQPRT